MTLGYSSVTVRLMRWVIPSLVVRLRRVGISTIGGILAIPSHSSRISIRQHSCSLLCLLSSLLNRGTFALLGLLLRLLLLMLLLLMLLLLMPLVLMLLLLMLLLRLAVRFRSGHGGSLLLLLGLWGSYLLGLLRLLLLMWLCVPMSISSIAISSIILLLLLLNCSRMRGGSVKASRLGLLWHSSLLERVESGSGSCIGLGCCRSGSEASGRLVGLGSSFKTSSETGTKIGSS